MKYNHLYKKSGPDPEWDTDLIVIAVVWIMFTSGVFYAIFNLMK